MADAKDSIFTEKAANKLRSPDDLDNYVRVTNPSVWIVLTACIALLLGLFSWGIFGTATTSVSATGTCVGGEVVCFLSADDASKVHTGDDAKVDGDRMKVASIGGVPLSRDEARDIVGGDYLMNTLVEGDWTYVVRFKGEGTYGFEEGVPLPVNITTERIAPFTLIFGNGA